MKKNYKILFLIIYSLLVSCNKEKGIIVKPNDSTGISTPTFDINTIKDSYDEIANPVNFLKWGPYNVHDPSIFKFKDTYYCYNTDAAFGYEFKSGIPIRYSKDLVQWFTYGLVFSGLPKKGEEYIRQNGTAPFNGLWAPYVFQHNNEIRLYYSLSSSDPRRSVIGLATATHPEGPFTERGIVVTSANNSTRQTNAIDPTVITAKDGKQYMYYGSAWDGIYVLELDPSTGLAKTGGDIGKRIANRGFTDGRYNGNIEGPEIIFNEKENKYYLFIAYDWIDTKYNVRVCRSDSPLGPFFDFEGKDANLDIDHGPMIIAPYKFEGHVGWQGVSHCSVFKNPTDGQYYIAHQGRPGNQKFYMILHVRKIHWTEDGWPVASPERYAWEDNKTIEESKISGIWERIVFNYNIVPGYDKEQSNPEFQVSQNITLNNDKTIGNNIGTWSYSAPWLNLKWSSGENEKLHLQAGRDWENKKETIVFTGLNNIGVAIWGKKK